MQETLTFFHLTPTPHLILNHDGEIMNMNTRCEQMLGYEHARMTQRPLRDFVHEQYQIAFDTWLQGSSVAKTPLLTYLHASDGTWRYVHLSGRKLGRGIILSATLLNDEPISTLPEATPELPSLTDLYHLIQIDALNDSMEAIMGTLRLETVLDKILSQMQQVIPHDAGDIMLINDDIASIERWHGYDRQGFDGMISVLRFPIADTPLLQQMHITRRPVIIKDLTRSAQKLNYAQEAWMQSYVGVPIQISKAVIGFLNLVSHQKHAFNRDQLRWLNLFAMQAAIAIQNAHVHQQERELVIADERQRMAREIHDTVSQMLFSSNMIAESLIFDQVDQNTQIYESLNHLFRLNRGALAEMRLLLMEYKPENLVKEELPVLLERLKNAIEGRKQINVELMIDDGHPVPPNVRLVLYRITQEALNNIRKHAEAETAYLNLVSTAKGVKLEIVDNGIGFDPDTIDGGEGLKNMQTRANHIGADLRFKTAPAEGTKIIVEWARENA